MIVWKFVFNPSFCNEMRNENCCVFCSFAKKADLKVNFPALTDDGF
eukprot:09485.XXX_74323_74460_1 [CDS] Oithona nana genome sequencing.